MTFGNKSLEIILLTSFLIVFFSSYLMFRKTNICRVLLFFVDLFWYILQIWVQKLETKHLLYSMFKLFLVFYLTALIQLKLILKCFYKSKILILF